MRVVISGGGTGGHIYPALAVAAQLRDKYGADILYLGSDDGLETDLVPAAGFRMAVVKAGKLRRYVSWRTLVGVGRIPVGMAQAVGIVGKFRPHVAFTGGGYVAVPAGLAAKLNGVPLVMHQQDVPPNLSNRLIAPLATRISVAFADSLHYFPARKTLHLGNPVRQEILDVCQITPQQARSKLGFAPELPLLLVTGGSQGARYLNQVVVRALPELLKDCQVLQISGNKLFAETQALSDEVLANVDTVDRQRYRLVPYMSDQMPMALQAAELVICRAGAATLSELAVLGKPSILVPLPPAIGGSPQEINAEIFGKKQAAEVIRNAELKPELLMERVKHITTSPACLLSMTNAVRSFAKPMAALDIVETIVKLANGTVAQRKSEGE
ncbi:MAG TPA: undecaprenyldiphospho-muramoylpentapeptide beta-N-acetylglucosaminyltransferase [Ktedonobacteraceae bacterium]|jgi:UDP-N-acetylglucosamine--N-acetylmuramyl-(pentapeptide) pyrophosphoryl-undecaprenol N-acetylglucosamine transferase